MSRYRIGAAGRAMTCSLPICRKTGRHQEVGASSERVARARDPRYIPRAPAPHGRPPRRDLGGAAIRTASLLDLMTIQSDRWITRMARDHGMIEPFEGRQVREGVISYGVSSYGYDMRVAREFRIFTNVLNSMVDPKNFDPKSFVEFDGDVCIVPPNSFALGRSVEYFASRGTS